MVERPTIDLDPGHGLLDVAPPRRHTLGRWLQLAHTSGIGAVALALVVVGAVLGGILVIGQLAGAEMKGLERYGAAGFYIACATAIAAGCGCYALFSWRRREHFRLFRHGAATVGQVAAIEVLSRSAWWRRWRFHHDLAPNPTRGRFAVRYRYRVGDRTFEAEDRVDSRHGARALATLPEPRRGDRLTVLFDSNKPERSVLALAIGEGLVDP